MLETIRSGAPECSPAPIPSLTRSLGRLQLLKTARTYAGWSAAASTINAIPAKQATLRKQAKQSANMRYCADGICFCYISLSNALRVFAMNPLYALALGIRLFAVREPKLTLKKGPGVDDAGDCLWRPEYRAREP